SPPSGRGGCYHVGANMSPGPTGSGAPARSEGAAKAQPDNSLAGLGAHERQRRVWEAEHQSPAALLQLDSLEPSGGVVKFWRYLVDVGAPRTTGVEMGCGKGRNVLWLAEQGARVEGFDFSEAAIEEASRRARSTKQTRAHFRRADAAR